MLIKRKLKSVIRIIILFSILTVPVFFESCGMLKTVKLLRSGETKQKHFKTMVPFQMRMGLIVLKVKVNGVDCEYLLDTGAPNVISTELAQKLNLDTRASHNTGDSQGATAKLGFAKINTITIGGIDFLETGSAIADLKQSNEVACLKVEGFIGSNLMRKAFWKFDYENQIITISSSLDSLQIEPGYKKIKFTPNVSGTPIIDVIYNGHTDKSVKIDLGSTGDFESSHRFFKQLKTGTSVNQNTYSYGREASGLYGKGAADTTVYAIISNIKMGEVELNNQIVTFGKEDSKTIGTNYFKNNNLIIDWSKNEILLLEKKVYNTRDVKKIGFSLMFSNNKIFVSSVNKSSSVNEPKIGDQVLSINGKNYNDCSADDWCNLLYYNPLKNEVEINLTVLREGKQLDYKLKGSPLFE